jgi:hypothetical protein
MLKLERPAPRTWQALKVFVEGDPEREDRPAQFVANSAMSKVYIQGDDMISLTPPGRDDRLTRFIAKYMLWLLWWFRIFRRVYSQHTSLVESLLTPCRTIEKG